MVRQLWERITSQHNGYRLEMESNDEIYPDRMDVVTAALRAVVLPHASIERSQCGIIVLQFFNTPPYSFLPNKFPKFSLFGLLRTRPLFAHKAAETRSHRLRGHRCEDVWTHLYQLPDRPLQGYVLFKREAVEEKDFRALDGRI